MSTSRPENPRPNGLPKKPLIKRPPNTKYRTVLSVDGGGVRGIIPVMVLKKLESDIKDYIFENKDTLVPMDLQPKIHSVKDFDIDLTDYFDLVAGTSIGSWMACYVAGRGRGSEGIVNDPNIVKHHGHLRPGSMELCRAAILELSSKVFPQRNIFRKIERFFRPKYPTDGLEATLQKFFADTTMKDLETSCLVTSYDLERDAACSFLHGPPPDETNYTVRTAVREDTRTSVSVGALDAKDPTRSLMTAGYEHFDPDLEIIKGTNYRLRDIARASSSAPTYFRPARISPIEAEIPEELLLVDGGVVANNPTQQAITYAPNTFSPGNIRDVAVFSVGCGVALLTGKRNLNPGITWWLTSGYLLDAFRNGTGEYIQAVMDFWLYRYLDLPTGQYVRIQIAEPSNTDVGKLLSIMDNPDDVPALEKIGHKLAEKNDASMKKFIKHYIFAT